MRYRDQLALLQNRHVIGDNHEELRQLPDNFFHCAVTSPPYFGLRDYGTRRWFGGDPECPHEKTTEHGPHHPGQVEQTKWKSAEAAGKGQTATTRSCLRCEAWYGQLGLEPTPELYVAHLVEVFREVKRVLRPDGVFWLNVGDSYARGRQGRADGGRTSSDPNHWKQSVPEEHVDRGIPPGYKDKDLIGIPWMLALALRADGWYLRQEIIWEKPNVMPESVRDRPTRAHEQVFLLTKSRDYFYDQEADRELFVEEGREGGRNLRSVWKINPQPYRGAHFAVFPMRLPERCIKLGTSEHGACAACGAPFERVVERVVPEAPRFEENVVPNNTPHQRFSWDQQRVRDENPPKTVGWEPTCKCKKGLAPCIVLDPFLGSGTTVAAAIGLLRSGFGIEINPAYEALIVERKREPEGFASERENAMAFLDM